MSQLIQAFHTALALDGLLLLLIGVLVAGLVRGFSGFGTALIYMPIAGNVLTPTGAVITMLVFDIPGTMPILRGAIKDCHPRDVMQLGLGALVALPVGLLVLSRIDPDLFRWAISGISLALLGLLIVGWRYHGVLSRMMTYVVGGAGGFLAGASGLAGPPVIMLYMSSRHPIKVIRANILLYLFLADVTALGLMGIMGLLSLTPIVTGLLLVIPYGLANYLGSRLFRPDKEQLFRLIAYILIAFSALGNLPLFR